MENDNNFIVNEATGKYIFAGNLNIDYDTINKNNKTNKWLTEVQISLKYIINNIINSLDLKSNDTIAVPLNDSRDLIINIYNKDITLALCDVNTKYISQTLTLNDIDCVFKKEKWECGCFLRPTTPTLNSFCSLTDSFLQVIA